MQSIDCVDDVVEIGNDNVEDKFISVWSTAGSVKTNSILLLVFINLFVKIEKLDPLYME